LKRPNLVEIGLHSSEIFDPPLLAAFSAIRQWFSSGHCIGRFLRFTPPVTLRQLQHRRLPRKTASPSLTFLSIGKRAMEDLSRAKIRTPTVRRSAAFFSVPAGQVVEFGTELEI
jgi:hypothetical protein